MGLPRPAKPRQALAVVSTSESFNVFEENCLCIRFAIFSLFGDGKRNKIKLFDLERTQINIKSFKVPNLINTIAYKYFRKSKARRSFEFANILLENKIGTPQPIAYFENSNFLGLKGSLKPDSK